MAPVVELEHEPTIETTPVEPAPRARSGSQRRVRTGARPKVNALRELRKIVGLERHAEVGRTTASDRPKTRGDCKDAPRPCPWVGCKYHLAISVNPASGALTMNFPDLEPWQLEQTCALDVADRGGATLEEVGKLSNVTRERARQLEGRGLRLLRESGKVDPNDLDD